MLVLLMIRGTDPNNNEATKENSIGPQKYLISLTPKKRKEKATPDQENNDPYFDPEMKKLMDQLDVRVPSRDELENYITKSNNILIFNFSVVYHCNFLSFFIKISEVFYFFI